MTKYIFLFLTLLTFSACTPSEESAGEATTFAPESSPYLVVLGIAQDAGYPQAGCQKNCCRDLWTQKIQRKMVTCLGLVDPQSKETWLFEATPDFPDQLQLLNQELGQDAGVLPKGIFISHAHMGHYTGLMNLGREAMGAKNAAVWTMPRMTSYLTDNGPWSQLVSLQNIQLQKLKADSTFQLNERLKLTPFLVPHRDEFSETVGFKIEGTKASALFIPDIDKWERWDLDIREELAKVDFALIDGTFFENGEIPGRDMALIPHPFIEESRVLFADLPLLEKNKIHFIHFNHTNPVLKKGKERALLKQEGFGQCEEGDYFAL